MNKIQYPRILSDLLFAVLCVACTPLATPSPTQSPEPETETPKPTASPVETATPTPLPTATRVPATPTSPFAPICKPDVTSTVAAPQCGLPIAEQSSNFCQDKSPYNLILLDQGATYELLSEGFECSDAGTKDGKQLLICTGPMASYFEIKACGQACVYPTPQTDAALCPQEFLYDESLGCCAFAPPVESSCIVLGLTTRRCVINCAAYTKQSTCDANSFACAWDDEQLVCKVKK